MGDISGDIAVLTNAYSEHYHNKHGFLHQIATDALERVADDGTFAEYRPIIVRVDGALRVVPVHYSVEAHNAADVFAARAANYTDMANAAMRIATANAALAAQFAHAAAPVRALSEVQITGSAIGCRSYSFAFSDCPFVLNIKYRDGVWSGDNMAIKEGNKCVRISCGAAEIVIYGDNIAAGYVEVDGALHDLVKCEIYPVD